MGNARDRSGDTHQRGRRGPVCRVGHDDGAPSNRDGDSHGRFAASVVLVRTPRPANDTEPTTTLLDLARDLGALAASLHWEGLLTAAASVPSSTNLENSGHKNAPGGVLENENK